MHSCLSPPSVSCSQLELTSPVFSENSVRAPLEPLIYHKKVWRPMRKSYRPGMSAKYSVEQPLRHKPTANVFPVFWNTLGAPET